MSESVTYTVEIHHSPEYGYEAAVKELPGCFAAGDTLEELHECLAEGISLYLSTPEHEVKVRLGDSQEVQSTTEERVLVCN